MNAFNPMRRQVLQGGALALITATSSHAAPAQTPFSSAVAMKRAKSALDHHTAYAMGRPVPLRDAAWSMGAAADCSAFVLWSFGLNRDSFPNRGDNPGSTDAVYNAVMAVGGLFTRVPAPQPGGLVVYPSYTLNGDHDAGHIAIILSVASKQQCFASPLWASSPEGGIDEGLCFDALDCSSTSWWTYGDAIQKGPYTKFLLHDQQAMLARAAGATTRDTRRPVFAVLSAEARAAAPTVSQLGHC